MSDDNIRIFGLTGFDRAGQTYQQALWERKYLVWKAVRPGLPSWLTYWDNGKYQLGYAMLKAAIEWHPGWKRIGNDLYQQANDAPDEEDVLEQFLRLYPLEAREVLRRFLAEEVAGDKERADLERRREMKFREVVALLADGDVTSLTADKLLPLHERAEAAIGKWRERALSPHHAEPRTPIERLCRAYCDIEMEIDRGGVQPVRVEEASR